MGQHRLTARMMNDINSLFYCTPLRRNVTGFPTREIFFKNIRHGRGFAALHQKAGEVAARHRAAIGQSQCPFPRAGNMGFFQTLRNEPTACLTPLCLLRQKIAHCRMRNINIQTHNVNLMILPDR